MSDVGGHGAGGGAWQFGIAWWLYIDGAAFGSKVSGDDLVRKASGYSWIPGFVMTIVFFMCV